MSGTNQSIRSYVDRILSIMSDIDAKGDDKKEVYKELANDGFDRSVVSQLVGHLRKKAKKPGKFAEQSQLFDTYLSAYEGNGTVLANAHAAREPLPDHDAETGEILDTSSTAVRKDAPDHNATGQSALNAGEAGTQAPPVDTISGEIPPIQNTREGAPADEAEPTPKVEASSVTLNPDCAKPDTCQFASKSYLCSGCNSVRAERLVAQRRGRAQ